MEGVYNPRPPGRGGGPLARQDRHLVQLAPHNLAWVAVDALQWVRAAYSAVQLVAAFAPALATIEVATCMVQMVADALAPRSRIQGLVLCFDGGKNPCKISCLGMAASTLTASPGRQC